MTRGILGGWGPKNRDFFGPLNGTSAASAIWAQKSRDFNSILLFNSILPINPTYVGPLNFNVRSLIITRQQLRRVLLPQLINQR
jgi:hypothetical protein